MKLNQTTLMMIGAVAAIGAGGSIYLSYQGRKKDQLAAALIQEIRKVIHPSRSGLMAESAFGIGYKDDVLRRVEGGVIILKKETAQKLASELNESFAAWWQGGDDEDRIYGVFRRLKDKVQVSQVADAFYNKGDRRINLIDKLHDKLTPKEVQVILDIVKELPAYRRTN